MPVRKGFWLAFAALMLCAGCRLLSIALRDFVPERDLPGLLVITTFFIIVPALYIISELRRPCAALCRFLKGYLKPKPPETPVSRTAQAWPKRRRRRKREPEESLPDERLPRTGEILKELGIKRERVRKVKAERNIIDTCLKKYEPKEDRTKEMLLARWKPLLCELMEKGFVHFDPNSHYGKLRGKDIARAFYRDLKRLGYRGRVRLILDDYDARVEWVEN